MQLRVFGLLALLAAWNLTSDPCFAQSIVNGSFTDGSALPLNWEPGADSGQISVVRDTKTFASAPASIRVDAAGGAATGKAQQAIQVAGNRSYRLKGKLKANKITNGGLALVMFAPAGKQTGWNEVAMITGTQDWCAFDSVTFVPPTTETVVVMVYGVLEAGGSLWADDLSIEPVADTGPVTLLDFRGSALRSPFDTWIGKYTSSSEGTTIQATGRGGARIGKWFDLSKRAAFTPVLELKALPGNTVTQLSLTLREQGGERVFQYAIPSAGGGFVAVSPSGSATLARPGGGTASAAPGTSDDITIRGNGNEGQQLAVVLRRIELVPPGAKLTPVAETAAPAKAATPARPGADTPLVVLQGGVTSYPYGAWEQRVTSSPEGLRVPGLAPAGGITVSKNIDLRPMQDHVPVVIAKTLPGNQARIVRMLLIDSAKVGSSYDCEVQESGEFVYFRPRSGVTLRQPTPGQSGPLVDLGRISEVHIQGNYGSSEPMAMVIQGAYLQAPGAAQSTPETVVVVEDADSVAAAAPTVGNIVQSTTGSAPVLRDFSVEAADLLALEIEAQNVQVQGASPYTAEADDTMEDLEEMPGFRTVYRDGKAIGTLDVAAKMLYRGDAIEGISLTPQQVSDAEFQLVSTDDRNYATAAPLRASGIKARPSGFAIPSLAPTMRYSVYLALPKPLVAGRNYELTAPGLQIKPQRLRYEPAKQTVQSLHVNQAGFRPDDPSKTARLSLWLGTGGKSQIKASTFQVLDDVSGRRVMDGRIESFYPADRPDSLTPGHSLSQADVFILDFSALKTPGKYRLFVPEIGNSRPFEVQPAAWEMAFTTVMHSFYSQRSGIDIGSPYAQFRRPRNFHTLEGTRVRVAGFSLLQTSLAPGGAGEDFRVLAAKDKPGLLISDAMGGYFDNGVSTVRQIGHLDASRQLLELMIMYPQYFTRLPLSIPEAGRKEADLVDEILWNLEFYSKLQLADGGVCGAVVDPIAEMQYPVVPAFGKELLALAPDVYASYTYAATAARAAVVMRANTGQSQRLRQSAIKAFDWAEGQPQQSLPSRTLGSIVRDRRNLAAAELLRLTGEPRYRDVFGKTTCLTAGASGFKAGGDGFDQREAVFIYARLPETSVDVKLRQAAIAALKSDADQAVAIAAGNAWGLNGEGGSATFYSTRAVQSLLHGHYLLKDESYLKAAITHASFILGGNPANTSFVTSLGWQSMRNPMHSYTRLTRQPLPMGLVLNGVLDPRRPGVMDDPAIKDAVAPLLQPGLDQWPAAECLLDVYIAKPTCDYSVQDNLGPTAYLLGYLAGR